MRSLPGFCARLCLAIAVVALVSAPGFAQSKDAPKSSTAATKSKAPANNASDADIAAASKAGKVWVNTDSGVYHKSGRYFGKTKQGKFMTEDEAKKAGYHEAKKEIGVKKQ